MSQEGIVPALDFQTVTPGTGGSAGAQRFGYITGDIGSITDGTSNVYGGAVIMEIAERETTGNFALKITGVVANSGWTTITVNGTVYTRASGSYSNGGGNTTWTWPSVNSWPTPTEVRFD